MSNTPSATKIATLWMDAMSKPGATQLKALSEVVAEDFSTATMGSKADALAWFGTWPGRSMFRTGTWSKPLAQNNAVTAVCMFDSKAAYYRGIITLTLDNGGLSNAPRSTSGWHPNLSAG